MFVHVQLRCTRFVLDSFNSYVSRQLYWCYWWIPFLFFDTQLLKLLRLFQTCKDVTCVLDSHFLVDRERKHSDATSINVCLLLYRECCLFCYLYIIYGLTYLYDDTHIWRLYRPVPGCYYYQVVQTMFHVWIEIYFTNLIKYIDRC